MCGGMRGGWRDGGRKAGCSSRRWAGREDAQCNTMQCTDASSGHGCSLSCSPSCPVNGFRACRGRGEQREEEL